MCSALIRPGNVPKYARERLNHSPPKAEVTGSNPVGCALKSMTYRLG
jgi:hypothetical protein